jgi:hypothetical protein
MHHMRDAATTSASLLLVLISACGTTARSPATSAEGSASASQTSVEEIPDEEFADVLDLDPGAFSDPTAIDNRYWPLTPGTQFIYEGSTTEDDEQIPHRIVFTVTDLTKEIAGVRTVVVYDRDYTDDALEEAELVFLAQDDDGNVWHLGQYRETYDEVEFVGGRVWLIGLPEGARAGIMMPADPQPDSPSYSQGYAPEPFTWTDRARVYQTGEETSTPTGTYTDVLVMEEFSQEEPGSFQLKYYAPGVGNVRVGWRGEETDQEELELVELRQLDAAALAEIRAEALALEERAYMYGQTPPAETSAAN